MNTTDKQKQARQQNIKKAVETRKEQGRRTKELQQSIKQLKAEKDKSIEEQIYNIRQEIQNVRFKRPSHLKVDDNDVDYRQEYFKLLMKYEKILSIISLEAEIEDAIDDIMDNQKQEVILSE